MLQDQKVSVTSITMLTWQQLGQYAKVPPRATFVAQFAGTILGAILNYVIYDSIVSQHEEVLLDPIGTRIWSGATMQG